MIPWLHQLSMMGCALMLSVTPTACKASPQKEPPPRVIIKKVPVYVVPKTPPKTPSAAPAAKAPAPKTVAKAPAVKAAAPARAHRSTYTGYYYNAPNPGVIAAAVESSLKRDPTGHAMLDPAKCRRDGSCATPLSYVVSFRAHDPFGNWTLENLASKMRRLIRDCSIKGKLQMDRIDRATGRVDINGLPRYLAAGECAWVNPDTHQPVLAEHCANPVGVRIEIPCVIVDFQTETPAEYAVTWGRYIRPRDQCFAFRRVATLFEQDSPSAKWIPISPGCIGRPCDLTNDNRFIGKRDVAHGQIPLDSPGHYQIRLEPGELLLLCLKLRHRDGSITSSFGNFVRWKMDYRLVHGQMHAWVHYETADMKADGKHIDGPDGLAFWASTREDEAQMQNATR